MNKEKEIKEYFYNNPELLEKLQREQFGCSAQWIKDADIPPISAGLENKLNQIGTKQIYDYQNRIKKSRKRFFAVAVPVTLALVLFFTVTTPGKALAETMFRTVGQLFDGAMVIRHDDSSSQIVQEDTSTLGTDTFSSIEQAAAYVDNPLAYINDNHVKINQIVVQDLEGVAIILTYYKYDDKNSLILQQQVFKDRTARTASTPVESDFSEYSILNDYKLFYTNTLEGNLIAVAEWDNTQIQISSDNMSENDFINLFQSLITT